MKLCRRGHPTRFDPLRNRDVCDTCERPRPSRVLKRKEKTAEEAPLEQSSGPAKQAKLAIEPGLRLVTVKREEDSIQNSSVGALRGAGYEVLVNTVRLKGQTVTCDNCGQAKFVKPKQETGQTPGIPDVDACHTRWAHPLLPAALWLGLEQKATRGQPSKEQKRLRDLGLTIISRSVDANLAAVCQVDRFFEYVRALEALHAAVIAGESDTIERTLAALSGFIRLT